MRTHPVFPPFGIREGVRRLPFASFKLGNRLYPIVPLMFCDLRDGVVPANSSARFMVTLQECLVTLETLNQATTFFLGLPAYQRYAIFGPMVIEAVSLFDTLQRLAHNAEGRSDGKGDPELSEVMTPQRLATLAELKLEFGKAGYVSQIRDKVLGHRHPILGGGSGSPTLREIIRARELVESPRFFPMLSQLHQYAGDVVEALFERAHWARLQAETVTELYCAGRERELDVAALTKQLTAYYGELNVHPSLADRVTFIGAPSLVDAETGEPWLPNSA